MNGAFMKAVKNRSPSAVILAFFTGTSSLRNKTHALQL